MIAISVLGPLAAGTGSEPTRPEITPEDAARLHELGLQCLERQPEHHTLGLAAGSHEVRRAVLERTKTCVLADPFLRGALGSYDSEAELRQVLDAVTASAQLDRIVELSVFAGAGAAFDPVGAVPAMEELLARLAGSGASAPFLLALRPSLYQWLAPGDANVTMLAVSRAFAPEVWEATGNPADRALASLYVGTARSSIDHWSGGSHAAPRARAWGVLVSDVGGGLGGGESGLTIGSLFPPHGAAIGYIGGFIIGSVASSYLASGIAPPLGGGGAGDASPIGIAEAHNRILADCAFDHPNTPPRGSDVENPEILGAVLDVVVDCAYADRGFRAYLRQHGAEGPFFAMIAERDVWIATLARAGRLATLPQSDVAGHFALVEQGLVQVAARTATSHRLFEEARQELVLLQHDPMPYLRTQAVETRFDPRAYSAALAPDDPWFAQLFGAQFAASADLWAATFDWEKPWCPPGVPPPCHPAPCPILCLAAAKSSTGVIVASDLLGGLGGGAIGARFGPWGALAGAIIGGAASSLTAGIAAAPPDSPRDLLPGSVGTQA